MSKQEIGSVLHILSLKSKPWLIGITSAFVDGKMALLQGLVFETNSKVNKVHSRISKSCGKRLFWHWIHPNLFFWPRGISWVRVCHATVLPIVSSRLFLSNMNVGQRGSRYSPGPPGHPRHDPWENMSGHSYPRCAVSTSRSWCCKPIYGLNELFPLISIVITTFPKISPFLYFLRANQRKPWRSSYKSV